MHNIKTEVLDVDFKGGTLEVIIQGTASGCIDKARELADAVFSNNGPWHFTKIIHNLPQTVEAKNGGLVRPNFHQWDATFVAQLDSLDVG